jgi:HSP20 family protein
MQRLVRHWDPWRDLDRFCSEAVGERVRRASSGVSFPAINIWQSEDGFRLIAEVPGLSADDLDITVTDDTVTIKGARPQEPLEEGETLIREERASQPFSRAVKLPCEVDPQQASATYEKGVLTLTLNRPAQHKPKKVAVRAV